MKGEKMLIGLSYIDRKFIEESENDTVSGKELYVVSKQEANTSIKRMPKKSLIILVAIIILATLTGAALFTRWSRSAENRYHPSQEVKEQAEKSGLSVMMDDIASDNNVLSATDQGITVTAVQTVVDQSQAMITFRIEGFNLPDGYKPAAWYEQPTLGGNSFFYGSCGRYFYCTDEGYVKEDGSIEFTLSYRFNDTSGVNLGKEFVITFLGFGTELDVAKAVTDSEKLVEGRWELRWKLTGTSEHISIQPNFAFPDLGATLTEAEVGQLTMRTTFKLDYYYDKWGTLGSFQPDLSGIRMNDGTIYNIIPAEQGYIDENERIFFVEYHMVDAIVDMTQVDCLLFHKGWELDDEGNPTVQTYYEIPIQP